MEFKIGAALACVGIAVGIGQWLIPPDKISYEIRFTLIIIALLLFAFGLCCLIHVAWRYLKRSKNENDGHSSPLRIEFEGDSNVRYLKEPDELFPSQMAERRFYGIVIYNDGTIDVHNVAVEIERIEQIADSPNESIQSVPYLGLKLKFKLNDSTMMTFSPKLRDRVPVISHAANTLTAERFRVASTQRYEFHHKNRKHRIHIKVTGERVDPAMQTFVVWVDNLGLMRMVREDRA